LDTFHKHRGDLFAHASRTQLQDWICAAQYAGMSAVVAGSLTRESLDAALDLLPDMIAVRGAACDGGREGVIDSARVEQLARTVHSATV
jgi:uncharacterized protein (UPF0264 family)